MLVPLWIPWTVTVALLLTALAAFLGDSSLPQSRPPRWVKRMLWVPGIVALVVTGMVTFERLHVSQHELVAAVEQSRDELEGSSDHYGEARVVLEMERVLGREVTAIPVDDNNAGTESSDSTNVEVEKYDVRPTGDEHKTRGPVVCLTLERHSDGEVTMGWESDTCDG